jgi:hypothetical protein
MLCLGKSGRREVAADRDSKGQRWRVTVPDEIVQPKGSTECIKRAVARLGPFRHKLHVEAEKLGPWEGLGGRIALSEQLAFERAYLLARDFNRNEHLNRNAPRSRQIVDRLTKLETLTGELARFLDSLDDLTRHRLKTFGTGLVQAEKFFDHKLWDAANASGLPPVSGSELKQPENSWINRLNALSQYANLTLNVFLRSSGIESGDLPDKGGGTNPYKRVAGSARWALVQEGWHVFELFKPGEATGTEGGPFHLFLMDIFEYATGLDPEQHSKLTFWLKKQSKANRSYQQLMAERERVSREQCRAWESNNWDENQARKFADRLIEIERKGTKLWSMLYPYAYGKPKSRQ